jgi:Ca-activated chloride channel family protein
MTVTVRVAALGYASASRSETVTDTAVTVDFALRAAPLVLDEMVSTGEGQSSAGGRAERDAVVSLGLARIDAARQSFAPVAAAVPGYDPDYNREGYAHIAENGFAAVSLNPLSTFSIDVDRASYSNVRRFINNDQRPPIDAVRIEELLNYFTYDYPKPDAGRPFSVTTEAGQAPWNPLHGLIRIGVQGKKVDLADLPPNNIVFLLDVSGSMQSSDKLPLLKQSFRLLVNELRPQDRVAIAVYAGAAGLVLPSTSGADKSRILDAIDQLEAGGSTAGGAGIRLAYDVAREHHMPEGNNRVILATDGDFNVGASSDAEMVRLIEEKRKQGTFLTVLGFGTGNLQDAKMEQLANHGNGNFAYIDNLMEARKVLVSEMGGTLLTIAKDVKIQVEFNPSRVAAYRLVGYENRLLAAEDFNNDEKDAGELGAGHSVTALYEIVPVGVESGVNIDGVDSLRYRTPGTRTPTASSAEWGFVKLRYKTPNGERSQLLEHAMVGDHGRPSGDFMFAAAVAGFGMLLRDSEHCGEMTLDGVHALASESRGADREGYRAEFVQLVERTRELRLLDR